mmetsp:Transcript_42923/g.41271  ORF Transcript_42923/g.41271 Transcript_42923/m.41271 type:complete len:124 (+) Transcript_42923:793-1164(+)|eukprot:CAMPEP_0170547670 /NCGR_PEP_ID=MMETSP0211-20121228/6042_1 /TAXON_ID=311385 /ORGANISM="Pseudokeronopsis sp., Strain OXSARD2" /LENGTH=123 /DNA_ID=CAMNT_0010852819 /DNA_START=738 /DNA_END=1109 /DNA_ORIENTATION=+
MEILQTEQLNHMIERNKLQARFMNKPISDKKEDMLNVCGALKSVKEMKTQMLREIDKIEKEKKTHSDGKDDNKKVVVNEKEAYLQEISQKTWFDEVYKNQVKIIEEKEKQDRQDKIDEMQQNQ